MLLTPAGCSIGDIRRTPPPPPSAAPSASPVAVRPAPVPPIEVRRSRVPVPDDYQAQTVEFTDSSHGYALFTRCGQATDATGKSGPSCQAILLATSDGGRSWQRLRHPRPEAANQQLYATTGEDLLLLAEPHGWYASTDRGRSYRRIPIGRRSPAAYHRLFGRFQVCCDGDASPRVVEWVGDRPRPLPAQPEVGDLGSVASSGLLLVAAGVKDGQPFAAVGTADGRAWRRTPVAPAEFAVVGVRVEVAPDGDAWLIGQPTKPLGFPPIWHFDGTGWEFEPADGHPPLATGFAALGFGLLAVVGPDEAGVIGEGRWYPRRWPVGGGWLRMLPDGTLFHSASEDGTVSIGLSAGVPPGAERDWIRIVLEKDDSRGGGP